MNPPVAKFSPTCGHWTPELRLDVSLVIRRPGQRCPDSGRCRIHFRVNLTDDISSGPFEFDRRPRDRQSANASLFYSPLLALVLSPSLELKCPLPVLDLAWYFWLETFLPTSMDRRHSFDTPSGMARWARRIERCCCRCATYFPLLFVYGLTTWAVLVICSIGYNAQKSTWIGMFERASLATPPPRPSILLPCVVEEAGG